MLKPMTDWWGPPKVQAVKCSSCGREQGWIHRTKPTWRAMIDPTRLFKESSSRALEVSEFLFVVDGTCNQCRSLTRLPCKEGHLGIAECYGTCYPTVPAPKPWTSRSISSQPDPTPRTTVPPAVRLAVFERDRYTCQACGASGHDRGVQLTIDHKKPLKRGGTNEMSNLQTLCSKCNTTKGTRNTGYGDSIDE